MNKTKKLEITKMLTISTAHISENTASILALTADSDTNYFDNLSVYEKNNAGFFIYILSKNYDSNIPSDLKDCIDLAIENNCSILCLDSSGAITDLKTYEW